MSDESDLIWLAVAVFAFKAWDEWMSSSPAAALQQQGARVYDFVHDDAGHKRDLPLKPWPRVKVEELATRIGFPDPHLAAAISMAESGGVPNALTLTDRESSIGLWQINIRAHPQYSREQMVDPEQNARAAFAISKGGTDWRPWSVWWRDADHRVGPGEGRFRYFL